MLFWGHSAAATFGPTFARLHRERTIGFVRYHSGAEVSAETAKLLAEFPALEFVGGKDEPRMQEGGQAFWKAGRTLGAPWAYVFEPDAEHMVVESVLKANPLLTAWVSAVIRQRLPTDGTKGLRPVPKESGWIGDNRTGEIRLQSPGSAPTPEETSWLPDRASAEAWRTAMRTPR